jgi:hypothetical protein
MGELVSNPHLRGSTTDSTESHFQTSILLSTLSMMLEISKVDIEAN